MRGSVLTYTGEAAWLALLPACCNPVVLAECMRATHLVATYMRGQVSRHASQPLGPCCRCARRCFQALHCLYGVHCSSLRMGRYVWCGHDRSYLGLFSSCAASPGFPRSCT